MSGSFAKSCFNDVGISHDASIFAVCRSSLDGGTWVHYDLWHLLQM